MSYLVQRGSTGAEVGNWQRFLREQGFFGSNGNLVADEQFGPITESAVIQWQAFNGIPRTGKLQDAELWIGHSQGFISFVQARNCEIRYRPNQRDTIRPLNVIVIHTMEAPEKPTTAETVARWFAGPSAPVASAHYCVDQDSIVQCVRDSDIAWHAPGLNETGIGIEHAGYAGQTAEQWQDATSQAILKNSAALVANLCRRYQIPVLRLSPDDLLTGKRGLCGHIDVTKAYPGPTHTHWDPGPNFPWDQYIQLVNDAAAKLTW